MLYNDNVVGHAWHPTWQPGNLLPLRTDQQRVLREDRKHRRDDAGFGKRAGDAQTGRVDHVGHRIAGQAIAGAAVVTAERIAERVIRQEGNILEENSSRYEGLNRTEVPAVALAVDFFKVEPAVANIVGLHQHLVFHEGALHKRPGADNGFTRKLDTLHGGAFPRLLADPLLHG